LSESARIAYAPTVDRNPDSSSLPPRAPLKPTAPQTLLLTGATGLLGSYLVRDLSLEGRPLAVIVRRERKRTAAARVDAIIDHWEAILGKRLPQPKVLEGDLTQPGCGLGDDDRRWVADHCDEVVHNAASLTFRGTDRTAEPWRTNVGGTANVLGLARATGLRHLHHISTAYVCGLREGVVHEADLDVGQAFGNEYEQSKVESEKLVRAAEFLDTVTVHRPSIIVGDSTTGWTSTYHGFFAGLRLVHTLLTRVTMGSTSGPAVLRLLGVAPADTKNFVPVDWVSAVIAHAVQSPAARGTTYHLTHPQPLSMDAVGRLLQEAVETYSRAAAPDDPDLRDEDWFADNLRTQLDIYRSYLRNDPTFDRRHTAAITAQIPCPVLDEPTLMRMAKFAIDNDFGRRPAPRPPAPQSPPLLASSWK
jgi:thioester reductase-like protein